MKNGGFSEFSEKILAVENKSSLHDFLQIFCKAHGFEEYLFAKVSFDLDRDNHFELKNVEVIRNTFDEGDRTTYFDDHIGSLIKSYIKDRGINIPKYWSTANNQWENFHAINNVTSKKLLDRRKPRAVAMLNRLGGQSLGVFAVARPSLENNIDFSTFHSRGLLLLEKFRKLHIEEQNFDLRPKELDCLLWSASGKTSFEIAQILSLSEHTVNQYFTIVATKLNASNRTHAVAKAIQCGLLPLEEIL